MKSFLKEEKILDRYRILDVIKIGKKNIIFKAFDEKAKEVIALKSTRDDNFKNTANLKEEFRKISLIYHKNIANIYNFYKTLNFSFYTMEWLENKKPIQRVKNYYRDNEKIGDLRFIKRFFPQIILGIYHLHSNGIIHRDLKPENIMIDKRAVIIDFDLSIFSKNLKKIKYGNYLYGTFAYMAPEVLKGEGSSCSSDLFSIGVILYEVLTGRLPEEIALGLSPPSPSSINPDIPIHLSNLSISLLNKEKALRPTHNEALKMIDPGLSKKIFLPHITDKSAFNNIKKEFFFIRSSEKRKKEIPFSQ